MPDEPTPAPQESRGIYGFVLFILMNLCTFTYFVWMLLPTEWIRSLPYEPPQPYWGIAVPVYLCTTLFLFAFCLYPAMHGLQEGALDESTAFTDEYSLPSNYFDEQRTIAATAHRKGKKTSITHANQLQQSRLPGNRKPADPERSKRWTWSVRDKKDLTDKESNQQKLQEGVFGADACLPIPAVSDMDLDEVCQVLYLDR